MEERKTADDEKVNFFYRLRVGEGVVGVSINSLSDLSHGASKVTNKSEQANSSRPFLRDWSSKVLQPANLGELPPVIFLPSFRPSSCLRFFHSSISYSHLHPRGSCLSNSSTFPSVPASPALATISRGHKASMGNK